MKYDLPDVVHVESDGSVRIVRLARPEQLNAINDELHFGLARLFPQLSADADALAAVITGEGRIDAQTAFGKTALGVARRAEAAGKPCIAVGGGVDPDGIAALAASSAVAVPVVEQAMSIEAAMAAGTTPLERCGERIARLISLRLN